MSKRLGNKGSEGERYVRPAGRFGRLSGMQDWRDLLAKIALFLMVISLWYKGLSTYAYPLLGVAWLLDGGLRKFGELVKEPLILAILVFCGLLTVGMIWGGFSETGQYRWVRYFRLLPIIPFLALLNKDRLPWVVCALVMGYTSMVLIGVHQVVILGMNGLPMPLKMSYLRYSLMVGVGIIVAIYLAGICKNKKITPILWLIAVALLFVQFHQDSRAAILATVITAMVLISLLYRTEIKTFFTAIASFIVVVIVLSWGSGNFQERVADTQRDLEYLQRENYGSSLGYRLAMWDVGLHGILEHPLFGQGSGLAESYFEKTAATYKGGIYKDLPKFNETSHYHNDWIEAGVQLGALGILAFAFFLYCWFRTLRKHNLTILGTAFLCYFVLAGLTNTLMFSKVSTLLLVLTAVAMVWQREYGLLRASIQETEPPSNFIPLHPATAKMSRYSGMASRLLRLEADDAGIKYVADHSGASHNSDEQGAIHHRVHTPVAGR